MPPTPIVWSIRLRYHPDGIIDYSAIELGLIIGNYSSLALIVNLFDFELREDQTEPLLPV